jgi:rhodanese-related sulfurtransferase
MKTITRQEIESLGDRCALIDIRDLGEYEDSHLPGATPLPRPRIDVDLPAVVPDTSAPLVLYGAEDARAELAAATAQSLGYIDVRMLEGGIDGWVAAGGKVHSGTNVPSKVFGENLLHEDGVAEVTVQELASELDGADAPLVLDVRTGAEFLRGCIPGAVNLPGGDLVRAAEVLKQTGRPVVTHCAGRTRSLVAAATLARLGVANVRALRNGTMGWLLDGRQVETPKAMRRFAWPAQAPRADQLPFDTPGITASELNASMREVPRRYYLFDVRSQAEYEQGHLPGALHVPGGQLVQCADDHIALRAAMIVVISSRSERSAATAWWLRRMGYSQAINLDGGVQAWRDQGLAIETGARRLARVEDAAPFIAAADLARQIGSAGAPTVLDLGSSIRYGKRHVPGAHWIGRSWLEIEVPRHAPARSAPLVITGASREQSQLAARALADMGYTNVQVLTQSIDEWREAKLPLEDGMTSTWSRVKDLANLAILNRDFAAMQRYLDWEVALAGKHAG